MKRLIAKVVGLLFVYYFLFKYLNVYLYSDYKLPWFSMDVVISLFVSFIFMLSYLIMSKSILFYIILIFNVIAFATNKIEIVMLMLYLLVILCAWFTNLLYKENKKAGYLSLIYLCFVGYLLLSNQIIILIN